MRQRTLDLGIRQVIPTVHLVFALVVFALGAVLDTGTSADLAAGFVLLCGHVLYRIDSGLRGR